MPLPCQRYLLQAHSQMCPCWLPRWQGWCFLKWPCILLCWSESSSAEMDPKNGFVLPGLALRFHEPASCRMRLISLEANWDLTQAESVLIRKFKDQRFCHFQLTFQLDEQDHCRILFLELEHFTLMSVSHAGFSTSATPCTISAQNVDLLC